MKVKRDIIRSTQTLKVFPESAEEFWNRFLDAYPQTDPPVVCPLDTKEICERARGDRIPIKN